MLKMSPHPDYPPEEGTYLRGNDFSPVAVAIILKTDVDKIPPEVEKPVSYTHLTLPTKRIV